MGRVSFGAPLEHEQADFRPAGEAELKDQIVQVGGGLAYRGRIGRLRLNAGILRTNYRKDVSGPGILASKLNTSAWLYNASAAYDLSDALTLYGGYSRGLEEAGIAPASAQNRYEVLEPAQARQVEAAAIVRLRKDVKLEEPKRGLNR